MDAKVWLMFALTEGALTLSPGPAVLLVVSQGMRFGARDARASALGILAANASFFAISGTGVGAVLATSHTLFAAVQWAGAGYLLFLGARALLAPAPPATEVHRHGGAGRPGFGAHFTRGLVLQLSNPKALLFFAAILPQFVDRGEPIVPQLLVFGATSIGMELLVLVAYGAAAARAGRVALAPRFQRATSRVGGLLLLGAGVGLARLEP